MVNKDQLEQTPEGKQVLVLMADHFSDEEFQPALTLIEQLYIEDQTVWDAGLNHDGKWPFVHTTPAHRLLIFFEHPDHLERIKSELQQRQLEHEPKPVVKPVRPVRKSRKPKKKAAALPRKKKPTTKRSRSTGVRAKAVKSRAPKARKPVRKPSAQKRKPKKPAKARRR